MFPVWDGGGLTGGYSLRRLCVGGSQVLHLPGFRFPGSFFKAALLAEAVRPPAGQRENLSCSLIEYALFYQTKQNTKTWPPSREEMCEAKSRSIMSYC